MKSLITTIIAFAVCISVGGQQISQSNNRYRGNDALEKKQVTVISFDQITKCLTLCVCLGLQIYLRWTSKSCSSESINSTFYHRNPNKMGLPECLYFRILCEQNRKTKLVNKLKTREHEERRNTCSIQEL